MNRFDCMTRLAARLRDELVVLSLGASVDEWYKCSANICEMRVYSSNSSAA